MAGTRKIPGGAVTLLAEMGHRPLRVGEEVYARMPEAQERRALVLGEGEPVLCLTRVTGGEEGPFQMEVSVFSAARQRLYYDMRTS